MYTLESYFRIVVLAVAIGNELRFCELVHVWRHTLATQWKLPAPRGWYNKYRQCVNVRICGPVHRS